MAVIGNLGVRAHAYYQHTCGTRLAACGAHAPEIMSAHLSSLQRIAGCRGAAHMEPCDDWTTLSTTCMADSIMHALEIGCG